MADDPHDGEATVVELFDEAIAAICVMLFVCKGGNGRSFGQYLQIGFLIKYELYGQQITSADEKKS